VIGLFAAVADGLELPPGARRIEGRLTASVPTETRLAVSWRRAAAEASIAILQDGQPLVSGVVGPPESERASPGWSGGADGFRLPMSDECLACGAQNPIGLRLALEADRVGVWARLTPPAPWHAEGGPVAALAPVLLDEVAWWLGARTMGEGGLTNRIGLALHVAALPAGPLIAAGRLDEVTPIDRKRTFWRTLTTLSDAEGRRLATAAIVFRGGPDYSRRQVPYFRARATPEVFRGLFPAYAG